MGINCLIPLYWKKDNELQYSWNDVCIWAMEQFGLPGSQTYTVNFTDEYLIFSFDKEEDAILMILRWQ